MQVKRLAAALVAATPLFAFAQTNVTLYGVVDAAIESSDTGANSGGRRTFVNSGDQSASRIGFRGTEDLGNGLKAIFNLEAGLNVDTGAADSQLFQRRAVVGLEGAFGTVTLGREYSPIAAIAAATDAFGQGFYGSNLSAFSAATANTVVGGVLTNPRLTRRLANSVNYKSADYMGFKLLAAYSAGENTSITPATPATSSGDLKSIGAEYSANGLYVGAAYAEVKRLAANNDKQYAIGAGYTFTELAGLEVKGNYLAADPIGANNKFTQYNLGAGLPVGPGKVLANWQQNKLQNGTKGTAYALAYTYALSKRTNLYTSYSKLFNKNGAAFALQSASNAVTPAVAGADPSSFTVGVRHSF